MTTFLIIIYFCGLKIETWCSSNCQLPFDRYCMKVWTVFIDTFMSILSELSGHLLYCLCFACFAVVERIGRSMERASSSTTCSHKIHKKSAGQNGRSWSSYTCSCWWRWNHCACRYQCFWDRLSSWLLCLKAETNMYPFFTYFLQILMLLVMVGYILFKESSFICHK